MTPVTITISVATVSLTISLIIHIVKITSLLTHMQDKINEAEKKIEAIGKKKDQLEKDTTAEFRKQEQLITTISTKIDYIKSDIDALKRRAEYRKGVEG